MTGSTPGNDMRLSVQQLEASRNFANKIWNAARFVTSNLPEGYGLSEGDPWERELTPPDRWILSRHNRLISEVNRLMKGYQFGEAGRQIYEFLWGEYCDWYIEASKVALYGDDEKAKERTRHVLVYVLERTLRLLHPFMPFVTEEIWQHLPHEGESLIIAPWPEAGLIDEKAEDTQQRIWDHVREIRDWRAHEGIPPHVRLNSHTEAGDLWSTLAAQSEVFGRLAGTVPVEIEREISPTTSGSPVFTGELVTILDVVPSDIQRELQRLSKELEQVEKEIARAEALLANENFTTKAPPEVVDREREKLARFEEEKERLLEKLEELS